MAVLRIIISDIAFALGTLAHECHGRANGRHPSEPFEGFACELFVSEADRVNQYDGDRLSVLHCTGMSS